MDIGCYNINVARMLFGDEPARIESVIRRDAEMGIDIVSSAVLGFAGGGQSTFTCSTRADDDQWVHIVGTAGRIDIEVPFNPSPHHETRILVTAGGDPMRETPAETIVFPAVDQYTVQAELFAQAVLDDTPVPFPVSDAIANLRVIEAIVATSPML